MKLADGRRRRGQPTNGSWPPRTCPVCGEEFVPYRKDKVFCSNPCQQKAKQRRQLGRPIATPERHCPCCGKLLTGNMKQKYCSQQCQARALYRQSVGHPLETPARACVFCGGPISTDQQINARYCCDRCKASDWARRERPGHRAIWNQRTQASFRRSKLALLDAYGSECECCGETDPDKLTIDHIKNDGKTHRKLTGSGTGFYQWLKNNTYPEGFRLLCYNCNGGRQVNGGTCPHVAVMDEPLPPGCAVCGEALERSTPICSNCRKRLKELHGSLLRIDACVSCGAPITQSRTSGRGGPPKLLCQRCLYARVLQRERYSGQQRRWRVLRHYGGETPRCAYCGESNHRFLTIDHVAGDGAAHRREFNLKGGNVMYKWLEKNGCPDGFQLLCMNCNFKKGAATE